MVIGVSKKSLNFDLDNGGLTVLKKPPMLCLLGLMLLICLFILSRVSV